MRKRRIWLLLLLLAATIYTALGCYGIVPGVDFVSYDAHMMYGRIADDEQHVGQAVRELQAAVRKARTAEQRSDAYAELAEVYAKERSRLYEFPANSGALCWTELQKGRIRSAVTFFWRGQYYNRAERNSALVGM